MASRQYKQPGVWPLNYGWSDIDKGKDECRNVGQALSEYTHTLIDIHKQAVLTLQKHFSGKHAINIYINLLKDCVQHSSNVWGQLDLYAYSEKQHYFVMLLQLLLRCLIFL